MKSRSTLPQNGVKWRHDLMFSSEEVKDQYPEYAAQAAAFEADQALPKDKREGLEAPRLDMYDGTDRDTFWLFRRHWGWGDTEELSRRLAVAQVDWEQFAKDVEEDKETAVAKVTAKEVASYVRAYLSYMTIAWQGPYFTLPEGFTVEDFTGSGDAEEAETVHELAGQLMPTEPEWLNLLDKPVVEAAKDFLDTLVAGRNPDQEATFRARPAGVVDSGPNGRGNRAARRAAGTGRKKAGA